MCRAETTEICYCLKLVNKIITLVLKRALMLLLIQKASITLSWTLSSRSQGREEKNLKTLQEGGQKQGQNSGFLQPAHVTNVEDEAKLSINSSSHENKMAVNNASVSTFSSSSVKSSPLEDLLMAWATPMISPSLLRMGMHRRDLVLYPVSLSISSLKRRSCNPQQHTGLEPSHG